MYLEMGELMPELDYREIGRNIRLQRVRKGLKQKELAELVNVSAQHISHIETNRSQPSLPILVDIANNLESDVDSLLGANLTTARLKVLESQIAEVLDGAPAALVARVVVFCKHEMEFYKTIGGLSNET